MIRVGLLLACLAAPVAADPAAAKQLVEQAVAAAATGDYQTAVGLFAKAYQEDPSDADAFCNIGISYFKLGEVARAHLLLSQCLDRTALDLALRDKVRAVVVSLEEQLRAANHTPVTLRTSPPNAFVRVATFGPESEFSGGRTIWLPFGAHQVEVRATGYTTDTITVEAKDQLPTTVQLAIEPVPVISQPTPAPTPAHRLPRWPAITATVVTVGAGLVAAIAFGKAHDAADRAPFAIDEEAATNVADEVSTWNGVFGVSTGLAIVAAGASGYLWYRALHTPKARVEITPTAGGAAVTFGGRF